MRTVGRVILGFFVVLELLPAGCSEDATETEYYGDFGNVISDGKEDGMGTASVPSSADSSDTVVWEVRNSWSDSSSSEARKAGLAWSANSGLDWNEKFAHWVDGLPRTQSVDGYTTFTLTNPQGKTLPAPALECAESAYFLRAAFASWYGLPFYMEAVDGKGSRVFFGHFGWRTASGRYLNSPLFKTAYKDYSSGNYSESNWPKDLKLRAKKLFGNEDDFQPFLGTDARAGTYFDEMFLNKRVGHFLILFLSNFGSIHLADSANTFNLKPEALRVGDILLERWQKIGIGHTLIVKTVNPGQTAGKLVAELASGSMPRRQPKWEDEVASKGTFTSDETGGQGASWEGDAYAKLGGGLKRWRVATIKNGCYINTIFPQDVANWISSADLTAIAARPGQFQDLLEEVDPLKKREALLQQIQDARTHLQQSPASCSARSNRERAFDELYTVNQDNFGIDRLTTDRTYRKFEDYVFAELQYSQSKTCCWDSSTAAMFEIIMAYNQGYVRDGSGNCRPPMVFMNDNGYGLFKDYAASIGRAADWLEWSEDEPCTQRSVVRDVEAPHSWADFCTIIDSLLGGGSCQDDQYEQNDSIQSAVTVPGGTFANLVICPNDDDWFRVHSRAGAFQAAIQFVNASGDLDLELTDDLGAVLASSNGSSDGETVNYQVASETDLFLHILGYNGAQNHYTLTITLP